MKTPEHRDDDFAQDHEESGSDDSPHHDKADYDANEHDLEHPSGTELIDDAIEYFGDSANERDAAHRGGNADRGDATDHAGDLTRRNKRPILLNTGHLRFGTIRTGVSPLPASSHPVKEEAPC